MSNDKIEICGSLESVKLTKEEIFRITPLARELYRNHEFKKTSAYPKQLVGMLGEYAAIKFFNILGATPRIVLNRNYSNGYDGGLDFAWPNDKITWDVKTTVNDSINRSHVVTSAGLIIGVHMVKLNHFNIWGFAKLKELPDRDLLPSDFTSIFNLKTQFPNYFRTRNNNYTEFKEPDFTCIKDIIFEQLQKL